MPFNAVFSQLVFVCAPRFPAMKRDATEMSLPGSGSQGDSSEHLPGAKRTPPAQQLRKF